MTGAGRTDGGVHALGQVAHVDIARDWEPFRLCAALNAHLRPAPVAVVAAAEVAADFHARFDAVEREYVFRLVARRAPLVHDRGLAWRVGHRLDVVAMREAAAALVGRHDFTTFRSSICQAKSPVRKLDALEIEELALARRARIPVPGAGAVVPAQPGARHGRDAGAGRSRGLAAGAGRRGARGARPGRLRAGMPARRAVPDRGALPGEPVRRVRRAWPSRAPVSRRRAAANRRLAREAERFAETVVVKLMPGDIARDRGFWLRHFELELDPDRHVVGGLVAAAGSASMPQV